MKEFVEFLGGQSPYDRLDPEDLARLAGTVEIEFFPGGQEILGYGAEGVDHIYVIRTGSVEVVDRSRVVDVLGPGDTFGHIAVFSGLATAMSARAGEDTLCYRLPDPRTVVADPAKLRFSHFNTLIARTRLIAAGGTSMRMERPVSEAMKPVMWCDADESVRQVAVRMTEHGQKATLMALGAGYGIVTDDDFRRLVATGDVGLDAPVSRIASNPVQSVSAVSTVWATYLHMVDHGIHHMVVTDASGRPVGISAVMEMAAADVRHPLVVRSAVASARTMDELSVASALLKPTIVELWDADVSSIQLGAVISAVVDAIVRRIIDLHPLDPVMASVDHSWVLTGSMGRQEPLPDSDVDTALIWSPTSSPPSEPGLWKSAAALLEHFPACGLRICPHDANASFPLFNRSAPGWRRAVSDWVGHPEESGHLIMASASADARALTGQGLGGQIEKDILGAGRHERFMRAMVRFALAEKPPVGFVRNKVIERFGERHGSLDLKRAGLRPIISLARVLALRAGNLQGSTPERLDTAASSGALSQEESEILKEAFNLHHGLLAESAILALRDGTIPDTLIKPSQLDPLRRRYLRDSFRAISRIQERVGADPNLGRT